MWNSWVHPANSRKQGLQTSRKDAQAQRNFKVLESDDPRRGLWVDNQKTSQQTRESPRMAKPYSTGSWHGCELWPCHQGVKSAMCRSVGMKERAFYRERKDSSEALVEFLSSLPWHGNVCMQQFTVRTCFQSQVWGGMLGVLGGPVISGQGDLVMRQRKSTPGICRILHRQTGAGDWPKLHSTILLFSSYSSDRERTPREKLGAPGFG